MKKLLLLLAAVGVIFTACQGGGDVEEDNGGTPFVPEITISPKDLTFGCNGGEQEVVITANFEYEVAKRASWLTVEQTDEGLLVVVEANKNTSERSAFISITNSQYDINKSIEVCQEGYVPKIELVQQSVEVEFEPAEYEVVVTSPYSWEATSKNDWIKVITETGIAGTKTLKFSVVSNEDEEIREGTIVVKNEDYNIIAELYVTQKAFVPAITIEPESLAFAVEGGTQEIAITANFEYEASANTDWLTIEKSEKGVSVTVPNYVEVDERTAEITISNEKYGVSKVVNVTQGAFVPELTVSPESLNFTFEGGTQEIAITANFEYAYSSNADWLTIKKSEKGISVTAPNYVEVDERTAKITISNEKYGISKVVKATQRAFVPAITIELESLAFAVEGGTQEVAITANFEYEFSTNADWLTIEKSDNGISVTAQNNVEVDKRTAEIIISNEKYGISKVVNVTQGAFAPAITIEPESLAFAVEGGTQEIAITANFEYEYSTNANWLTIENSESGIKVTAKANANFEERTAEITISSEKYGISKTIAVTQKGVSAESQNVILYTSSDGKIVTPYNSNVFGANIVSNTYNNGQGVIIFDAPVTSIGEKAFYNCTSLTSVTIGNGVTSIGNYAFYECSSLTSVTIPDSVTSIGERAFEGCTGELIVNCNIPSVSSSDKGAFYNSKFTKVTIGDSVTSIGDDAFSRCESLTSVTIPDSVTSIGDYAFYKCSSLTSVTIPNSVAEIGYCAFAGCTGELVINCNIPDAIGIRHITTDETLADENGFYTEYYGVFQNSQFSKIIIGNGVTSIGRYAFRFSSKLTSVTIPDSITSIGEEAFRNCESLNAFYGNHVSSDSRCLIIDGCLNSFASAGLTEYIIPNSVTSIGDYAFDRCTSLTSITIPESVTLIGKDAFNRCIGKLIVNCNIPNYEKHFPFASSEFTEVIIGDSVTSIGMAAFFNCDSLTSAAIGNSVTSIGDYAFYNCTSLTSITIPNSVTEIGYCAFVGCSSLTSVTIPDSVTSIGKQAFSYCDSLTSVTMGNGIISFGVYAFSYCPSLKVFYGDYASSDNRCIIIDGMLCAFASAGLTQYTIPNSVMIIGNGVLYGCTSLTSITIPDSVTSIGYYAFADCTSLTSVYCKPTTPPTGGSDMFNNNASGRKIYVPTNSVDAYKAAEYWSGYASDIVGYDF